MSVNTEQLTELILDWESGQKHFYEDEFEHFTYRLGSVDEEIEIGGYTLKFVAWADTPEAGLFVFSVGSRYDGELYALRGSISSWGNDWDRSVYKVQPKTVVLETYEVI